MAQTEKTVTVTTPGTLSSLITEDEKKSITGLKVIGNIDYSDFDVLRDMASEYSLTSLDLSKACYNNSYNIYDYRFSSFTNLQSLTLPDSLYYNAGREEAETGEVTDIDLSYAYSDLDLNESMPDALTELTISSDNSYFTTDKGILYDKAMRCLFYCPKSKTLGSFTLPSTVQSISYSAFKNNTTLTSFSTAAIDTLVLGNAVFEGCTSLKTVNLNAKYMHADDETFEDINGTLNINFGENVITMDNYNWEFMSVNNTNIVLSIADGAQKYKLLDSNVVGSKDGTKLYCLADYPGRTSYTIPEGVTDIMAESGVCRNITDMVMPSTLNYISTDAYFDELNSLTLKSDVTTEEGDHHAFEKVGTLYLSGNCSKVPSIWLIEEIGDLKVTSDNNNMVQDEQNVVFDKNKDELMYYPKNNEASVYNAPTTVTTISSGAFTNASNLNSISVPSVKIIGAYAFKDCNRLTNISFSDNATAKTATRATASDSTLIIPADVTIGEGAFEKTGFTDLVYSEGIDTIKYVGYGYGMSSIVLPSTTKHINVDAFKNIPYSSITCNATVPPTVGANEYGDTYNFYTLGSKLYVPEGSEDTYKATEPWSSFYNYGGLTTGSGTVEDPFISEDVQTLCYNGYQSSDTVYVKGKVTIISEVNTTNGYATFKIGTDNTDISAYNIYYLGYAKFTSENQIATGDVVVLKSVISYYNGAPALVDGCIYSINGLTTGINGVKVNQNASNAPVYNLGGQRVSNSYKGVVVKNGKKMIRK